MAKSSGGGTVYLSPLPSPGSSGGVMEVVRQLVKSLPVHGWTVTSDPVKADIAHAHAFSPPEIAGRLDVYTNHGYYDPSHPDAPKYNPAIERAMKWARRVTSVAAWPLPLYETRLGVTPTVIHNGVDLAELDAVKRGAFRERMNLRPEMKVALWAKVGLGGTVGEGFQQAAALAWSCPLVIFIFTAWPTNQPKPRNVIITGTMPRPAFLEAMADCDVFLSTTLENCPVAVLEAMAMRKPVLWLAEGGNAEIEPAGACFGDGDLVGAARGMDVCLADKEAGETNRATIERFYTWDKIAGQYAGVYNAVLKERAAESKCPVASIIITNYNMGLFLRPSVESAVGQDFKRPFEVIVVDDCSTDGSLESIADLKGVRIVKQKKNGGVARARNAGVEAAKGLYCCCLDGDDRLAPSYLSDLVPVLEGDKLIGIVAPKWGAFNESGKLVNGPLGEDGEVSFEVLKQGNQLPCASLFRKKAWHGQNPFINPSWEDYDGWLSIGEAGWKIVNDPGKRINFAYTVREKVGRNYDSRNDAARLRAVVNAFHPRLYQPAVSVVIPVYSHPELVGEAIGSVMKQTLQDFEIILVDDGMPEDREKVFREAYSPYFTDPRVIVVHCPENGGLAAARNIGVAQARADYIFPLDDDDMIDPPLLERALAEMKQAGGNAVVYCDYYTEPGKPIQLPDYDFDALLLKDHIPASALYPKSAWEKVGGYCEDFTHGMEDWDFWIRLGAMGVCGVRIPEAWLFYRQHPGGSMRSSMIREHLNETKALMVQRNLDLFRGVKPMGCCGNKSLAPIPPTSSILAQAVEGLVWLKYIGNKAATVSIGGYLVSSKHPYIQVKPQDVQPMLNLQLFVMEAPKG